MYTRCKGTGMYIIYLLKDQLPLEACSPFRLWPSKRLKNGATGCGNTFHTRQTQFWELHVSTFFEGPMFEFSIYVSP